MQMSYGKTEVLIAGSIVSLLVLTACNVDLEPSGPTKTETRSIDLDKSELARVEFKMGAGELRVRGGSPKLMEGEFSYNRPSLKPEIHYDSASFRSNLIIEEPSNTSHGNHTNYRWEVKLNDEKPIDMEVHFGAGEGQLDLGTLNLRSLAVHMGVGELRVDLRGKPSNSYNVSIQGGVGEVTVYLPEGVGVVADAKGGIGGVSARNLEKRDGEYVNDLYGKARTTIRLDIKGGIGAINLIGS